MEALQIYMKYSKLLLEDSIVCHYISIGTGLPYTYRVWAMAHDADVRYRFNSYIIFSGSKPSLMLVK